MGTEITQPAFQWYIIEGVNPEPWAASEGAIGKRNGKPFIQFHKPEQLRQYQESVKDIFSTMNPHHVEYIHDIELVFYFWRQLTVYEPMGEGKSTQQAARADATNMQKALEDALQGILYKNDTEVKSIRSVVVEQERDTEPCILICAGTYTDRAEINAVSGIRDSLRVPIPKTSSNIRNFDVTDVF